MYYIKKLIRMISSLFFIGTFSFLLLEWIPGDPATAILGVEASAEDIQNLQMQLGLHLSFGERYFSWMKDVLHGNLGISFKYGEAVSKLILERIPITLSVALFAIILVFVVSIPLAFFLHRVKIKKVKDVGMFVLGFFISIPSFWLGILFMYIFGIILRWTSTGYNDSYISLFLPCLVIAIPKIGYITMHLYANLYKELREDYIKYLYSNGMKKIYLNFYILKNAILPIVPLTGILLLELVTGVVIIEQIFSIPGIGRLLVSSVFNRDIPLVQGLIFYTSTFLIIMNFFVDIIYSLLDPRIKLGEYHG